MISFIQFIIVFSLLILFSRFLDKFLSRIFPSGWYHFFVWPGILVHEFSHVIAAKLTGAKIIRVSLFSRSGGSVTHTKPRLPLFGKPIVSFAPLFGAIIALFGLIYFFDLDRAFFFSGQSFSESFAFAKVIFFVKEYVKIFSEYAGAWKFWIFLYFSLSLLATLAPSNQDFKNAWWGILFLVFLAVVMIYFRVGISYLENIMNILGSFFFFGVFFEAVILLLVLPFWIVKKK